VSSVPSSRRSTLDTWLAPQAAQIGGLRLDDAAISAIVAALSQPKAPIVPIDRVRLERQRRELALDVAGGRMSERAFLAAIRRLNEGAVQVGGERPGSVDGTKAINYIRNFASSWAKAMPSTRATMIQSLYEEIVVRGAEVVSVRLSPEAYARDLALALPQEVVVAPLPSRGRPRKDMALARPTGVGRALATYEIPIEGRGEWLAAARRMA
jgi:hypothetical protein